APSVRPRRVSVWDMVQASRGKFDRLRRTPAGSTSQALDGYGLRGELSDRPTWTASDPVSVRQVAVWLHAAFRRRLATTPLRFASTSPPSGCAGDLHPQAVEHARHTSKPLARQFGSGRPAAAPRLLDKRADLDQHSADLSPEPRGPAALRHILRSQPRQPA